MSKSRRLRHKASYEVIQIKYWSKPAQILESDFGKPQNRETFR